MDLEAHVTQENRLYLLDFGRMFPPETVDRFSAKGSFLYRLLRPEFVSNYKIPLCSDAYSKFIRSDPDYKRYNKDIEKATRFLLDTVIPKAAAAFDKLPASALEFNPVGLFMHRHGINMRHLAVFFRCCSERFQKQLCLVEMLARCIKHSLREQLVRRSTCVR
jgi:hypothetical protein